MHSYPITGLTPDCHHRELQHWWPTKWFAHRVELAAEKMKNPVEKNWWREAWEASQFARIGCFSEVRLSFDGENHNGGFDFEVRTKRGHSLRVQSTLVDAPRIDKRVRDHHERLKVSPHGYTCARTTYSADHVLRAIAERVEAKSKKPPRIAGTALLLHQNLPIADGDEENVGAKPLDAIQAAQGCFSSIWLLYLGTLVRLHPRPYFVDTEALAPVAVPSHSVAKRGSSTLEKILGE